VQRHHDAVIRIKRAVIEDVGKKYPQFQVSQRTTLLAIEVQHPLIGDAVADCRHSFIGDTCRAEQCADTADLVRDRAGRAAAIDESLHIGVNVPWPHGFHLPSTEHFRQLDGDAAVFFRG
jgi:hypothetical protein